jgi:hypothetical protein
LARAPLIAIIAALLTACSQTPSMQNATSTPTPPIAQPSLSPFPDRTEQAFIVTVAPDLHARFPDERTARAAGYLRYTDEDQDGIISYTNLRWFADDPKHPTQLWYDVRGRLIGADYTTRVSDRAQRPALWGLQPGRWVHFIAHMHYIVREPGGMLRYGSLLNPTYTANGGDPAHPTPQPLVKLGIAKRPRDVIAVFQLPEIWIASMWLVPNPHGAFADSDPLVKPMNGKKMNPHPM